MNSPPLPRNEPVLDYRQAAPERAAVRRAPAHLRAAARHRLPLHIGSDDVEGTGTPFTVTAPHRHQLVLGEGHTATEAEVTAAIDAALRARRDWAEAPFEPSAARHRHLSSTIAGVALPRRSHCLRPRRRHRRAAAPREGESNPVFQADL